MKTFMLLFQFALFFTAHVEAKTRVDQKASKENTEIKILELKTKKELSDKKLSPQKKYTLSILAARDFLQMNHPDIAHSYYQLARDIKVDENKNEINLYMNKRKSSGLFFYEVNLPNLVKSKHYEKAILSMDFEKLNLPENIHYKIIYDLLNVKIRKRSVKKLNCLDDFQKSPDDYNYTSLFCDLLVDYLRDGNFGNEHIKIIEEYFLKHDLKERYLIQIAKDLKASL